MCRHGRYQPGGWLFDLHHLYARSARISPRKRLAVHLLDIAARQPLLGYRETIEVNSNGREIRDFATDLSTAACGQDLNGLVLSGTGLSCYQEPKTIFSSIKSNGYDTLNLDSNLESNSSLVADRLYLWITSQRGR